MVETLPAPPESIPTPNASHRLGSVFLLLTATAEKTPEDINALFLALHQSAGQRGFKFLGWKFSVEPLPEDQIEADEEIIPDRRKEQRRDDEY